MRAILAIVAATLAAGCSNTRTLTIYTDPPGALLTEVGTGNQYVAPVAIPYNLPESGRQPNGCFYAQPFTIRWASGFEVPMSGPIPMCGQGAQWHITITRPREIPGLDQDVAAGQVHMQRMQSAEQAHSDAMSRILLMGLSGAVDGYNQGQSDRAYRARENARDQRLIDEIQRQQRQKTYTCSPSYGNNYTCR